MKIEELIERDEEKMSGAAVFPGTGVPINYSLNFLKTIKPWKLSSTSFRLSAAIRRAHYSAPRGICS